MTIMPVDQTTRGVLPEPGRSAHPPIAAGFDAVLTAARSGNAGVSASHRVRSGETLSGIVLEHLRSRGESPSHAELYEAVDRVAAMNGLADADRIYPGQEIALEAGSTAVQPTEDTAREALVRALVPPSPSATLTVAPDVGGPKHPIRTFSSGRLESFREVASEFTDALTHPIRYAKGAESLLRFLPLSSSRTELAARAALKKPETIPAAVELSATSAYTPWKKILAEPARLTSEFGLRRDPFDGSKTHHDGIDLATTRGANIYPMSEGVVKFSGWMPGYGKVVVVEHEGGVETVYGHNAKNLVRVGEAVSVDDAIATVGSSGRSTGPHVHFEIRKQGRAVDPVPLLTAEKG